jgi:hydrogenase expression/formation protein HypD
MADIAQFSGAMLQRLVKLIKDEAASLPEKPRFMEVCGTHTVAIFRSGIRQLLDGYVELCSGPGCPVCVTPDLIIDQAIEYARQGCILTSYGDMLRVPGSETSLLGVRANGAEVKVVTSPLEALAVAVANPEKTVLFLAVGFETTAPGTALLLEQVIEQKISNLKLLLGHKLIPPAMAVLVGDRQQQISGFICPGHVAAVTGIRPFQALSAEYKIPCVVAGFETYDLLITILMLIRQLQAERVTTENEYQRVVKPEGNPLALSLIDRYFELSDTDWRGFGSIGQSGLRLRPEYQGYDALRTIPVTVVATPVNQACRCGEVLRGMVTPPQCPLFGTVCTPQSPVGPCMVSGEGVCLIYFRYSGC